MEQEHKSTAGLILARLPGAGRTVYGGQEPAGEALASAYRYWRKLGKPASRAIELAESECVQGRRRWPSQAPAGLASYQNKPDKRGGRWIEAPEAAGLRFVGFGDEIRKRQGLRADCTGYYASPNNDSGEVYRPAVYQLPADREGRPRYVPAVRHGSDGRHGWRDASGQEGAAILFLADIELGEQGGEDSPSAGYSSAMLQAARTADSLAERIAEDSRDYCEADSAGQDYASKIEEAAEARRAFLALRAELRGEAARPGSAVRKAIREALAEHVRTWRKRKAEAFELRATWLSGWRGEFREAFADSAGINLCAA